MIFEEKCVLLLIIFISSISAQKCKKPKVDINLDILLAQLSEYCQGNVGDSIPDKRSPCHEQVCTLVTKKAAAWVRIPAL